MLKLFNKLFSRELSIHDYTTDLYSAHFEYFTPSISNQIGSWKIRIYNNADGKILHEIDGKSPTTKSARKSAQSTIRRLMKQYKRA